MKFGTLPPDDLENQWRYQLDQFVRENQRSLAALAWGLKQEWNNPQETLGIDLKAQPHFVCCSRESLEIFNGKVECKIQEILGILDGYKPEEEVAIIAIGKGQVKLVYFQPNPSPPLCFEQINTDLDELIQSLETKMMEHFCN